MEINSSIEMVIRNLLFVLYTLHQLWLSAMFVKVREQKLVFVTGPDLYV